MKNLKTFVVICAMMMSTPAFATDKEWYVGASGGLLTINDLADACAAARISCEDSGGGFQGMVGYHLNDNISVDLGFGVGFVEVVSGVDADMGTIGLGATGYLPLGDQFSFYGKGGVHFWSIQYSSALGSASDDGTDPYLGLGAEFLFVEDLGVRAEYTRYFTGDDSDVDTVTIGLVAYF